MSIFQFCWLALGSEGRMKLSKNTPIELLRFVVVDTETTGFNASQDNLLTIGAVRVVNNIIDLSDSFELRILHDNIENTTSVPIHGIVPNKELGIPQNEALEEFIEYLGADIIIGHNIGFDITFINHNLNGLVKDSLKNKYLDTAKLSIRIEHFQHTQSLDYSEFTLDALCDRYRIPMHDRHNAAGDALLTALLFLKLLTKLRKRGIQTLKDLNPQ